MPCIATAKEIRFKVQTASFCDHGIAVAIIRFSKCHVRGLTNQGIPKIRPRCGGREIQLQQLLPYIRM
jgi:hypothetical protein